MNDVHGQVQFVPKVINGKCQLHLIYFQSNFNDLEFLDRLEQVSRQIVGGVETLGELDILLPRELALQGLWNKTERKRPEVSSVHALLEQQVAQTPRAPALVYGDVALDYQQFNQRVNQLAWWLIRQGVKPGDYVALFQERSIEMVISLFASLKAGAAYVPIDPELPAERVSYILKDSQPILLLSFARLNDRLSEFDVPVFTLDNLEAELAGMPQTNPDTVATTPESVFNVIYTSGSTGTPKGVMVPHGGIINRVLWMQETYQLTANDRVLQKTPYSFDVSVWEFVWPLVAGATLVICRPNGHMDADYLVNLVRQQHITTMHFVPSMLKVFLQASEASLCTSLRQVFCSGEALWVDLANRFFQLLPHAQLHNLYGPTEASIDVSYWACKPEETATMVPIGKPIANIKLHILDEQLKPLPLGFVGELFIEGVGLAKGYLNLPDRTAQSFIVGPAGSDWEGRRLYRTGDLARYREDGNIEFLGRADHQVKIRGYRIELGEVETALRQHSAIADVAVATRGHHGDDLRLVAYIVPRQEMPAKELNVQEIRTYLRGHLPGYMVPSEFFVIEAIPVNANGKLDRKALLQCESHLQQSDDFIAPRDEVEQQLAAIWLSILKVEQVGAFDSFFDLGGQSLLATQLVARIREQFQVAIGIASVFEMDVLAEQASFIKAAQAMNGQQQVTATSETDSNAENRIEIEI